MDDYLSLKSFLLVVIKTVASADVALLFTNVQSNLRTDVVKESLRPCHETYNINTT